MNTPLKLLVIEDNPADFALLEHHIHHHGLEAICHRIDCIAGLEAALNDSCDLVLADYGLPAMDFHGAITRIHMRWPDLPVILLSGTVSEEMAVDLLRLGLADFVLKDHLTRLIPSIHRALNEAAERRARQLAEENLRESQATAIRDREQARLAALNLMEDALSARARAERACTALLESEEKYRLLAENSLDWIFWQGPDGRNRYVSPACLDISGHRPDEFLTDAELLHRLIHPEDRDLFHTHLKEEHNHETKAIRFRIIRPDGEIRWLDHRCQLIFDDHDNCLGLHGSNRDISKELRLHAEQESLRSQLHQAQKMESVGRLAGGVAHDFNNKLGVILGSVELLLRGKIEGPELYQFLEDIRTAAKQSADLTRQLLAFARRQTVTPKLLNLNDTITSMLKMLQRLIGEDISLFWQPATTLAPVLLDPSQVDQILANLMVNARDALAGQGRITIQTANVSLSEADCATLPDAVPGKYVVLRVSDNGSGMTPEVQEKIFEPFFTTKGVGEGTGLGLSTVYGIVKQNQGVITVDSAPDQGTTFSLYFPQASVAENHIQQDVVPAPLPRGSETVLVVEDETKFRTVTTSMLKELGYQTLSAEGPNQALALAQSHPTPIHLLLSDVVMPGMNGRELAERISSLRPNIKCLFISGYTADIIGHHGFVDESIHFLNKPFSLSALACKLRQILENPSPVNPP